MAGLRGQRMAGMGGARRGSLAAVANAVSPEEMVAGQGQAAPRATRSNPEEQMEEGPPMIPSTPTQEPGFFEQAKESAGGMLPDWITDFSVGKAAQAVPWWVWLAGGAALTYYLFVYKSGSGKKAVQQIPMVGGFLG